jgi:VWFA-related protein
MKRCVPTLALLFLVAVFQLPSLVTSQTRERTVGPTRAETQIKAEVIKTDVDLVTVDALVLQKNTARVVGNLSREDFVIAEDGVAQSITHFSQDQMPLSVLLLIDRGGCLDPFGENVRHAAFGALEQLKASDEVAVMTYDETAELRQKFTTDRATVKRALDFVPEHNEQAGHCLDTVLDAASSYMNEAANPVGRRVVIFITGVTKNFDCVGSPSGKAAKQSLFESGSVVCGVIPVTRVQQMEDGVMRFATGIGGIGGAPTMDIKNLADETGGEVLQDKPEKLETTFNTLIEHLRTRYNLAFVSSNKKRDGTLRKLKIDLTDATKKKEHVKLVVKARRSYVAPKA